MAGQKFVHKYDCSSATIYRAEPGRTDVRVPPPGHPLHDASAPTAPDPLRVAAIDRDGHMTEAIEVWTDPDEGILWVLDGRGRWLDVLEVNRRRKEEGRDLVRPLLVPFDGDEQAAVLRVQEKNHHRRAPTPSSMALGIRSMRRAGHPWAACASALHVDTRDPEQWCRKILPLAFCIQEVREAVDSGKIPRSVARKFGGTAVDGSGRLGDGEQQRLLEEMLRPKEKAERPSAARAAKALRNGVLEKLPKQERGDAAILVAYQRWLDGDAGAMGAWPALRAALAGEKS